MSSVVPVDRPTVVRERERAPRYVWLLPGLLATAIGAAGLWRPVLWQDELATLSATSRSLPDLVRLTAHVDAVLGPYYALVHVWTSLVGNSAVALRLPSTVAVGVAAGVLALVGHRLGGPRAGLAAGLVLALSPSVAQYGAEARPYGLTLATAATATLTLVAAVQQPSRRAWVRYGATLVVLGLLQVTALVLVLPHLLALLARPRSAERDHARGAFVAVGVALVLLAPLFAVGHLQQNQIGWIPEPTWESVLSVPLRLFGTPAALGLMIVLALAGAALRLRTHLPADRFAAVLGLGVAVLPVVVIALLSLAVPLVRYRYLLYTQLGWALLAGLALARLGPRTMTAALALLLVLALPTQRENLDRIKVPGSPDYRALAQVLQHDARPGDAIVVPSDKGIRFRVGLFAYSPPGSLPKDVLAVSDADHASALDAKECHPAVCIGTHPRLWVGCRGSCAKPLSSIRPETADRIRAEGYVQERLFLTDSGGLVLMVRPAAG